LDYRTSRMLLLLGAVWAVITTFLLRLVLHFVKNKNFQVGKTPTRNLVLVGSQAESERVLSLLQKASVSQNHIGVVAPKPNKDPYFLSGLNRLAEVVQIYKIEEIIFCSKDISSQAIMQWMTKLGPSINYKIVPTESMSIIGSHSKDAPGELYTVDIRYNITTPLQKRNKRLVDICGAILALLFGPFMFLFIKEKNAFVKNIFQVLMGKKSWVGYADSADTSFQLPTIKEGVISPTIGLPPASLDARTVQRLNFLYAKDYDWRGDVGLIWKGVRSKVYI